MPKYVAFLRAINVGGHVVKMDLLRSLFEEMGFANVETFIASGNVLFDSKSKNTKALESRIEKHLEAKLGYAVATFVRSIAKVAEISAYQPFDDNDGHYVGFLAKPLDKHNAEKLLSSSTELDLFHLRGRELFWLRRTSFSDSKFSGPLLEKTLGMRTTLRNLNTLKRIAAKYL